MNQYKPGYQYKTGDKISGTYHNVSYSGTVRLARRHTVRHDLTELHVDLDKPIVVYSKERQTIIVSVLDSGKEF